MDFLSTLQSRSDARPSLHADGPLLILAGAGSGKTRVITFRMAHLVGEGRAGPDEVLAVTFTNKAAEECGSASSSSSAKTAARCGSPRSIRCARACCGREAPAIGLDARLRHLRLVGSAVGRQTGDEALDIDDNDAQPRAALARSARPRTAWNRRKRCADRLEPARSADQPHLRGLPAHLRDAGALDFDDLLLKTVETLSRPASASATATRASSST
jgi:DNA helicase-2/ATP-dependent DNA helicase PcrA